MIFILSLVLGSDNTLRIFHPNRLRRNFVFTYLHIQVHQNVHDKKHILNSFRSGVEFTSLCTLMLFYQ